MCFRSLFTLRHTRKRRNYSREDPDWEGSQKASIQLHKGQKPSWWKSEELSFSAGLQIKYVMQLIPKKTAESEESYKRSRVGLTAHLQVQIWDDFIWSWESFTLLFGLKTTNQIWQLSRTSVISESESDCFLKFKIIIFGLPGHYMHVDAKPKLELKLTIILVIY